MHWSAYALCAAFNSLLDTFDEATHPRTHPRCVMQVRDKKVELLSSGDGTEVMMRAMQKGGGTTKCVNGKRGSKN